MNKKFDPSSHEQNHVYDLNNLSNVSEVFQEYYRQQEEDRSKNYYEENGTPEVKNVQKHVNTVAIMVGVVSFIIPVLFISMFVVGFIATFHEDDDFYDNNDDIKNYNRIDLGFTLTPENPFVIFNRPNWIREPEVFDTYIDCVTFISPNMIAGTTSFFDNGKLVGRQVGYYYMDSDLIDYELNEKNLNCGSNETCNVYYDEKNRIVFKAIAESILDGNVNDYQVFISNKDNNKGNCVIHNR